VSTSTDNNSIREVNPTSSDNGKLTVNEVKTPLTEGKELPTGYVVGPCGMTIPGTELTRETLKENVEECKEELKGAKLQLKMDKILQKFHNSEKGDKSKLAEANAKVAEDETSIKDAETKLKDAEAHLRSLPPEVIPDDDQPWFGRIYANCTSYLIKSTDGNFRQVNETQAGRVLREMGISHRQDTQTTSPLDRTFNALHDRHKVDWWGSLAGYRPGVRRDGSKKYLITNGPDLITPAKGEFPTIREYIEGMLNEQAIYAHCWLHLAVVPLFNGEVAPGQILVLTGPIDSGKSVFQKLIVTPLLGGRKTSPYAFMIGRSDFNEDMFECEHLICEDESPRDHDKRLQFASELKKLAANESHWCHGKNKKAHTLEPGWRVTVSVNDTPDCLTAIPAKDDHMKDKMHVLKVHPDATVHLVERLGGRDVFRMKIREELPAYLHWLLNEFQIPAELKGTRYGMKAYQNQEIVDAIEETAPYMHLMEVMKNQFAGVVNRNVTLTDIASELQNPNTPRGVLPNSLNTLAKYLASLSKASPSNITRTKTAKGVHYTLNFPPLDGPSGTDATATHPRVSNTSRNRGWEVMKGVPSGTYATAATDKEKG